jgi:hypothetical protein
LGNQQKLFAAFRIVFTAGSTIFAAFRTVLAAIGFLATASFLDTTGRFLLAAIRGFSTGTHTTRNK